MGTAIPVKPTILQPQLAQEQQSEKALGHNEQTFRRIFDQMSQMIWLLSPDGILLEVNQAAVKVGGLQPVDVKGYPFWRTRWWSRSTQTVEQLQKAIASAGTGRSIRYKVEILGCEDTIVTTDFSLKPIVDEAGCIVQLLAEGHEITNHKQTETYRRNSGTYELQIFEKSQAVKLLIEPQSGAIVDANSAAAQFYGHSREKLKQMHITDINTLTPVQVKAEMKRAVAEQHKSLESSHRLASGEIREVEVYSSPIDFQGRKLLYSIIHDISDRAKEKAELEKFVSLLKATIEASFNGVLVLGLQGEIITFNQRLIEMWQIPEAVLDSGKPETQLKLFANKLKDSVSFVKKLNLLSTAPEIESKEILELKDGRIFEHNSRPQRLGKCVVGRVLIFRDITELCRTGAALRQSEARFRTLAEMTNVIIFVDQGKQFRYVNPAAKAITGYEPAELLDLPNFQQMMQIQESKSSRLHSQTFTYPKHEECRILTKSGEECWLECSIDLIEFEGKPAVLGTAVDVTKRKQAEAAIFQNLAQEKKLSQWRLHFASMLSHEIRRSLNIVSLAASAMRNYGQQWPEAKKSKYMHRILNAVNRMDELLKKALVIGQTDAGKLNFDPHPLDLVWFCKKLVSQIQMDTGKQHPISFVYQNINQDKYDRQLAANPNFKHPKRFKLDEQLLESILTNLLSNAIKYSPAGSPVSLEVTEDNEQVILRVKDQGIGIPLADQQKLFEPFHRARNVADLPGTGLGLAVVQKCVDMHSGQITCESEVGMGTTFTVKLPINGC